jgi:hypothetical protein
VYKGDRDLSVQDAVRQYFLPSEYGPAVHRVAVFDNTGAIEYVISQMDVLRYVFMQDQGKEWLTMSVKEAGVHIAASQCAGNGTAACPPHSLAAIWEILK